MKKRILIAILMLVCFWHFNVEAAEVLMEGVTTTDGNVTEVQTAQEEVEVVDTKPSEEEKKEETEDVSKPQAPPGSENSANVFLEENHENDEPAILDEEEKIEEKNIDENNGVEVSSTGEVDNQEDSNLNIDVTDVTDEQDNNVDDNNNDDVEETNISNDTTEEVEDNNDEVEETNINNDTTEVEDNNDEVEETTNINNDTTEVEDSNDEVEETNINNDTTEVEGSNDEVEETNINNDTITEEDNNDSTDVQIEVTSDIDVYKVAFAINGYKLTISGGSQINLSELNSKLALNIPLQNIEEVIVSDNSLLSLTKDDATNDYVIDSLKAFDTLEYMLIKTTNGNQYLIQITDDAGDEPAHSKIITVNPDGTYTISLNVTGDADTTSYTAANVNVVVVYDTSTSMTYNYVPSETGQHGIDTSGSSTGIDGTYLDLYRRNQNGTYSIITDSDEYDGTVYTRSGRPNNYTYTAYTGQRYAHIWRADAAEKTLYDFTTELFKYKNGENGTNIQMALVTFDNTVSYPVEWTTKASDITANLSTTGAYNSHGLSYHNYTNWEAALSKAYEVVGTADEDPTFVIFITDGAPTTHSDGVGTDVTASGVNNNYRYALNEAKLVYDRATEKGGTLYSIYAFGKEIDWLASLQYYASNGSRPDSSNEGTTFDVEGYYNASDASELNDAIASIFQQIINTLGIGQVSIDDGTTSSVTTSSNVVVDLLNVDETSYKYYMSWTAVNAGNGNYTFRQTIDNQIIDYTARVDGDNVIITWTNGEGNSKSSSYVGTISEFNVIEIKWDGTRDFYNYNPTPAYLEGSAVKWNLSNVGTLLNNVTYTVKFDVWPSQYTLDLIADLKNGLISYEDLDSKVKPYIEYKNGAYRLKTNTNASISYVDNRVSQDTQTAGYENPDPVDTNTAEYLTVSKEWENALDSRNSEPIILVVTRDGVNKYEVQLDASNGWENTVYISVGTISRKDDGTIIIRTSGHDYTFAEDQDIAYYWEIDAPVVRPMVINRVPTMLVKIDESEAPKDSNGVIMGGKDYYVVGTGEDAKEYYHLPSGYYMAMSTSAALTSSNIRKSNLNLTKEVDSDIAPDELFTYNVTIAQADKSEVWFSIWDGSNNVLNTDEVEYVTGATEEEQALIAPVISNITYDSAKQLITYYYTDAKGVTKKHIVPAVLDDMGNPILVDDDGNQVEEDGYYQYYKDASIVIASLDLSEVTSSSYNEEDKTLTYTFVNDDGEEETVTVDVVVDEDGNPVYDDDNNYQYYKEVRNIATLRSPKITIVNYDSDNQTITYDYKNENGSTKTYTVQAVLNDDGTPKKDSDGNYIYYTGYYSSNNDTNGVANLTIKLKAGWNLRFINLVTGTTYSVTEILSEMPENFSFESVNGKRRYDTVYDEKGNLKEYKEEEVGTIEDSKISGSIDNSNSEYTLKYTNEYELINIVVTKEWDDNSDQDGKRPTTLDTDLDEGQFVIILYADGEVYSTEPTTVEKDDENNTWTITWKEVNKYKTTENGPEAIIYTIGESMNETLAALYELTESSGSVEKGFKLVNTHTPEETEATVVKVWLDGGNVGKTRPTSLTVTLSDGTEVELNEENGWSATVEHLPKYKDGEEIEYTWTEGDMPAGYALTGSTPNGTVTTLTNTYETEATVEKIWLDGGESTRPVSLTVTLSNGTEVVLDKEHGWTATVSHLPMYNETTKEAYQYTWTESDVPTGYILTGSGPSATVENKWEITNTKLVEVEVKKVWDDGTYTSNRTDIVLHLTSSYEGTITQPTTHTTNNAGNWIYTYGGLLGYTPDGTKITFTLTEDQVTGYQTPDVKQDSDYAFTVTNKLAVTDIKVNKTWSDNGDQDGIRPTNATVQLYKSVDGGTESPVGSEVTVPTTDGEITTWSGLPTHEGGKEITYSVVETLPRDSGYTPNVTGEAPEFTIINTHTPEKVSVTITKTWNDGNYENRPTPVFILSIDGVESKLVPTVEGNVYTFANLERYRDGGTEIEYTVIERPIDGYQSGEMIQDENNVYAFSITNTRLTSVKVIKKWNDGNDTKDRDDVTITVTGDDGSSHTCTIGTDETFCEVKDLPMYTSTGATIEYTVAEGEVEGYVGSEPELTDNNTWEITNTKLTKVKVTKKWYDDNTDNRDTVTITVTGDDGSSYTCTIGTDETFCEVKDLPMYTSTGAAIEYTVAEDEVEGYVGSEPELTDTNTWEITNTKLTSVKVTKKWYDDNTDNRDTVTITVTGDDGSSYTCTIGTDETFCEVKDLPMYTSTGAAIEYTVAEGEVEGYVGSEPELTDTNTWEITNTKLTSVKVTKKWYDDNTDNRDTVTITVTGDDGSSYTCTIGTDETFCEVKDLPMYTNDGTAIKYTVSEDKVKGYIGSEPVSTGTNTWEITNTKLMSIKVNKVWIDGEEAEGRTDVTITLTGSDGSSDTCVIELGSNSCEFTDLPMYTTDGTLITYEVGEVKVDGYRSSEPELTGTNEYTITNTKQVTIKINKVWSDDDNPNRPESVEITIFANDGKYDTITLTKDNWEAEIDVDKYDADGTLITYSVDELEVPEGYEKAIEVNDEETEFTVHNVKGAGDYEPDPPPINPQTGDNIILYVIALLVSIIGLVSGKLYLKENN